MSTKTETSISGTTVETFEETSATTSSTQTEKTSASVFRIIVGSFSSIIGDVRLLIKATSTLPDILSLMGTILPSYTMDSTFTTFPSLLRTLDIVYTTKSSPMEMSR